HNRDGSPFAARVDVDAAAEVAHAFEHPAKAYTGTLRLQGSQLFLGNTASLILDFHQDVIELANKFPVDANLSRLASGVSVNVREALLRDTKKCQLELFGQPADLGR